MSEREAVSFLIGIRSKPHELQQVHGDITVPRLLSSLCFGAQRRLKQRTLQSDMRTDTDVVEDSHFSEQIQILEGSSNSKPGTGMRRPAGNVDPVQQNSPGVWTIKTRYEIEERGLSCSVRTYNAEDLIAAKRQVDVLQGSEAAEAHTEILDLKKRIGFRASAALQRGGLHVMGRDLPAYGVTVLGRQHASEVLPDEANDSVR